MSESFARETLNQIKEKLGMSDNAKDLIEALRLQGWDEQAELIEQLERERDEYFGISVYWRKEADVLAEQRREVQAKLAKAVEALRYYALEPNPWDTDNSLVARTTLAELEGKNE